MNDEPIEALVTIPFSEAQQHFLRNISTRVRFTFLAAQSPGEISTETWEKTEILYTGHILPEPEQAPALRWLQFHYAGIDRFADEAIVRHEDLQVTTLSGAAAPQMAEHILTMMMALGRHLPALLASQRKAEWPKDRFTRFAPFELRGKTLGIIGYGSVGRQLAALVQPLEMTVLAVKQNLMNTHDFGYNPGGGDPNGDLPRRLYPPQAVRSLAKECHFLAVTAPLTPQTKNLVNERVFRAMKPAGYLVDVSRGGIVNHADLLAALKDNALAGAALDVFPEEPLPSSSPLWNQPNVIISPHISGSSLEYNERAVRMFGENLLRYVGGLELYNRYDATRGY